MEIYIPNPLDTIMSPLEFNEYGELINTIYVSFTEDQLFEVLESYKATKVVNPDINEFSKEINFLGINEDPEILSKFLFDCENQNTVLKSLYNLGKVANKNAIKGKEISLLEGAFGAVSGPGIIRGYIFPLREFIILSSKAAKLAYKFEKSSDEAEKERLNKVLIETLDKRVNTIKNPKAIDIRFARIYKDAGLIMFNLDMELYISRIRPNLTLKYLIF